MPNLLVTVDSDLTWDKHVLRDIAARMERVLHEHFGTPISATNVVLTRAITAQHTADVFVEFLYRTAPGRDQTLLQGLADALFDTLPEPFDGSFAFRAFGHTEQSLFLVDLARENQPAL